MSVFVDDEWMFYDILLQQTASNVFFFYIVKTIPSKTTGERVKQSLFKVSWRILIDHFHFYY